MSKKSRLYSSEAEWLETGAFHVDGVTIDATSIRYALARSDVSSGTLITMCGGIPRDPERQRALPLINKLYGLVALNARAYGMSSLMYNQPATGGSGGDWYKETLASRTDTLVGLVAHFGGLGSEHVLIGTSAGAYMAIRAVRQIQDHGICVPRLILLSPAAYPAAIENVPYGSGFTRIIREPWDVTTSPAFSDLEFFIRGGGKVLMGYFEEDDPPIPGYIQEEYGRFARNHHDHKVSMLTIPGVAHNFRRLRWEKRRNVIDDESVRATADTFLEFIR